MAKARTRSKPGRRKSSRAVAEAAEAAGSGSAKPGPADAGSSVAAGGLVEADGYWEESCRPLVSLVFVAPILLAYEAGVVLLGADTIRNGADIWLRMLLDRLGFSQYFLLPLLTCSILLAWHHTTRQPWKIASGVFSRMAVETTAFAVALLMLAQAQGQLFAATSPQALEGATLASTTMPSNVAGLVSYLGAGLYEELLFRLMLLPAIAGVARLAGGGEGPSLFVAIGVSSLLFAAAHYQLDLLVGPWRVETGGGEAFDLFTFAFRWSAGALFGVLFVYRGFGIAVGTHALYDVLAVVF